MVGKIKIAAAGNRRFRLRDICSPDWNPFERLRQRNLCHQRRCATDAIGGKAEQQIDWLENYQSGLIVRPRSAPSESCRGRLKKVPFSTKKLARLPFETLATRNDNRFLDLPTEHTQTDGQTHKLTRSLALRRLASKVDLDLTRKRCFGTLRRRPDTNQPERFT